MGRSFLSLLILLLAGSAFAQEQSRKNVLFLISDDLNNFQGCYGDPRAHTPNLDRLAARGARFQHAYCSYPLCGPSRNSLLTGLYPNSTGIFANSLLFRQTIPNQRSLPESFRMAGYFAGRIGKLYHYNVPNSIGTNGHDDPTSWELEINPAGIDRRQEEDAVFSLVPGSFGAVLSWYRSPATDLQHTDGMLASDAEWVLERCARQRERPFFLAVGFYRPHTPYISPAAYFDLYSEEQMPVVSGLAEDQADLPADALGSYKPEEDRLTDELRRQCLQAYYASISFMDAQVGRVLDALDRLGLSDETIIVFTSDHGYHMGEHGLWQKRSLFEESARVPLLMVAPGVTTPGSVVTAPVSHVDLASTLSDLCAVPAPENLQGQTLVPLMKDPTQLGRGWALTQVSRNQGTYGYSLRTLRWRYTEWDEGRRGRELYDHENDPRELTNLAGLAEHQATIEDLSKQLHSAVKGTFPAEGNPPALRTGDYPPTLRFYEDGTSARGGRGRNRPGNTRNRTP